MMLSEQSRASVLRVDLRVSLADSEEGHWPARPHHRPKLSVFDQRPLDRRVDPAIGEGVQVAREQLLPLTGSDVDRFRQSPVRGP